MLAIQICCKVFPLSEKVDILTLVRKEQNCVEVGKMHSEE
jgi:hypothetical protein